MNRVIFTILSFLVCYELYAQTTIYFQLTKKIHSDIISTDVSGGQFVTFIDDMCFDSNRNGYSVGNGKLRLNEQARGSYKTYEGRSYWSDDTSYRFKSDLSVLNVVLDNGDVYVYKRATPPAGVTTCSLIRRPEPQEGGGGGGYASTTSPTQPSNPQGGYTPANPGGGSQPTTPQRDKREKVRRTCKACNGKGTYERNGSGFGVAKYKQRCNICGFEYWNNTTHSHPNCPTCHGRGYVEYWL